MKFVLRTQFSGECACPVTYDTHAELLNELGEVIGMFGASVGDEVHITVVEDDLGERIVTGAVEHSCQCHSAMQARLECYRQVGAELYQLAMVTAGHQLRFGEALRTLDAEVERTLVPIKFDLTAGT